MLIYLTVFTVVCIDQFTKYLALKNLSLRSIPLINKVLHLTLTLNSGAAFGILKGHNLFFVLVSIAVVAFLLFNLANFQKRNQLFRFSIGLIIGGALANLIDRIRYGYVVDFIDVRVWPVFNIADSSITIGIIIFIIDYFIKLKSKNVSHIV